MSADLADEYRPLAVRIVADMTAGRPLHHRVERDDLTSCALVALTEAALRYDETGGAKFSSYAYQRIRGAVLDEMRRADFTSRPVRDKRRRLAEVENRLSTTLGREPTETEVAIELGLTNEALARLRADIVRGQVLQLDFVNDDGDPVNDLPTEILGPEDEVIRADEARFLHVCVAALPSQMRTVIERCELGDETLTAVAADLGVTLARVSQIRTRALDLLRAALALAWWAEAVELPGGFRAQREQRDFLARALTPTPSLPSSHPIPMEARQ